MKKRKRISRDLGEMKDGRKQNRLSGIDRRRPVHPDMMNRSREGAAGQSGCGNSAMRKKRCGCSRSSAAE